jgi:hypothetical protein
MTKKIWDYRANELVSNGNHETSHDHLPLPCSIKVSQCTTAKLARLLIALQVPGVTHAIGRGEMLKAYAVHLDGIRQAAADAAVRRFLGPGT